jgi:hypothetical protein
MSWLHISGGCSFSLRTLDTNGQQRGLQENNVFVNAYVISGISAENRAGWGYRLYVGLVDGEELQPYSVSTRCVSTLCDSRCNRCFDQPGECPANIMHASNGYAMWQALKGCDDSTIQVGESCLSVPGKCGHNTTLHGARTPNCPQGDVYVVSNVEDAKATCTDKSGDGSGRITDQDCGVGF